MRRERGATSQQRQQRLDACGGSRTARAAGSAARPASPASASDEAPGRRAATRPRSLQRGARRTAGSRARPRTRRRRAALLDAGAEGERSGGAARGTSSRPIAGRLEPEARLKQLQRYRRGLRTYPPTDAPAADRRRRHRSAKGCATSCASRAMRVDWCRCLRDDERCRGEPYDAWLVDWQLPDGSGLDWLRAAAQRGDATPALMLTARDRLDDRIAAWTAAPTTTSSSRSRPRSWRRACAPSAAAAPAAPRAHRASAASRSTSARAARSVDGERAELTAREWAVLEALVLRAGRIVTKAELEKLVLGFESELASNALEVHVSALRRKLGRELVETVRGLGYRIGGPGCEADRSPRSAAGWPRAAAVVAGLVRWASARRCGLAAQHEVDELLDDSLQARPKACSGRCADAGRDARRPAARRRRQRPGGRFAWQLVGPWRPRACRRRRTRRAARRCTTAPMPASATCPAGASTGSADRPRRADALRGADHARAPRGTLRGGAERRCSRGAAIGLLGRALAAPRVRGELLPLQRLSQPAGRATTR